MATTEERVDRMRDLPEDNFLIEASHILNESYGDDDVTDDEHKVLFEVFRKTKGDKLPNPTSSDMDHLNHILSTRHSKNI